MLRVPPSSRLTRDGPGPRRPPAPDRGHALEVELGGGEDVAHSSVQAFHGLGPATSPFLKDQIMFQTKTPTAAPSTSEPAVEIKL